MKAKKTQQSLKARSLAALGAESKLTMAPRSVGGGRRRGGWGFRGAALLVVVLFLVVLETALRLAGFGYPTSYFLRSRAQGGEVWIENQKVTRPYFPPGLARSPQPVLMRGIKPPDTCRIFVLGESAAMGDPEPAFGFPRILEVLLRARHPARRFEVVNVSVTAINSHVIRRIARDCARREGDLWIVYMGNNEVVGPFGAGTVFGPQVPSQAFIQAGLAVKALRIGQGLDALWQRASSVAPREWEGMEMFLKQQVREDDRRMPAVYQHFQENLDDILDTATSAGAKVLLSTIVSNLKDNAPFASLHRPDLTASRLADWDKLHRAGVQAEEGSNYTAASSSYQEAATIDDRFAELQFRLGRSQWALGNYTEAQRSFEKARDLDTLRFRADTRINEMIRQTAAKRNGPGLKLLDAVDLFARGAVGGAPGGEVFFDHVHFNFDGNYMVARSLAEEIEKTWPEPPGASTAAQPSFLSLEECARRLALTDWDRCQVFDEMTARLAQPPFSSQLYHAARETALRQARAALQPALSAEGLGRCIQVYRQAVAATPGDWRLRENFARLLQSAGDPPGAEEQWRKVIALMPHYEQAYYSLGNVLDGQGKSAEAIEYFHQALRRRPESFEARNGLGLALAGQGQSAEAIREYEAALRRKPGFSEARVNLGQTLAAQGQTEGAIAQYESALRYDSNNAAAHINLGKLLAAQKQPEAAIEHYRAALRAKPESAVAHYNLGNVLASQGRSEEALKEFAEAVGYQPGFAEARYNLGVELARVGKTAEALAQFSEAVRLKPGFAEAHLNLGVALAKQRLFDRAIEQFQETLRLDPGNAAATRFLEEAMALREGGAGRAK